jgi:hypothetical protein
MADNTDTDLGAPLLVQNHDITLNGDSINLRDFAGLNIHHEEETARTPCPSASASSGDNKSTTSNGGVEESSSSPGGTTDPSSLSLDDRSSFTATDYNLTQSIRRGRAIYYRAKHKLSSLVAALTRTSDDSNNISDTINDGENSTRQITQKSSLSSSKSTVPFLKLLIPPLLIFNHIIFYQGQTQVSKIAVKIPHKHILY